MEIEFGNLNGNIRVLEDGEFPHVIISLDCGVEVGFEIAQGRLRALLYRNETEEAEITDLGSVEEFENNQLGE